MAGITLHGMGSKFGEGTAVDVFPALAASPSGGAPAGTRVATANVTTDALTFAGLTADVAYVAHAVVGGVSRYVRFRISAFAAGVPWKTVVANRRTAIGTS